ncbi:MAG TPA: ABC transporter permease subunit [Vicinamibacterales bacterium]|jgi:ABC-type transport system involved in multi-copper enzyme maturation permease subunit
MAIHDQGYRRYEGRRLPRGTAWAVIASTGIRMLLRRKAMVLLLLLAWLPFLIRAVQIYAASSFPQASFLAPTAQTFHEFLEQQLIFVFFVTVFAGSGLIAGDRRTNALQVYLAHPLTRAEYVAGKAATLGALLLFVTWVPGILLLLVQMAFAGNMAFIGRNLFLFPAITVFAWLECLVFTLAMLALSSLSKSSRFVAILYTALLLFSQVIALVLTAATGGTMLSWVSWSADLTRVGDVIFRLPPQYEMGWLVALLMIVGLIAASVGVLAWRVRGVEVVA